jgi:DNA-binding transcriptional regulator YiaG
MTDSTNANKPRRTYSQLQERARNKAQKDLRKAEQLRANGVRNIMVSTMVFAQLMGCSTKTIETWRKGEHWSNDCTQGYTPGSNHSVRYSLDCLHAGLAAPTAQQTSTGPFGISAGSFLGFATFESAVLVDEPWVLDAEGRVFEHAIFVSDEELDDALEHDRVRERTLAEVLLHEPWAALPVRLRYQRMFNNALRQGQARVQAKSEAQELSESLGDVAPNQPDDDGRI